MAEDTIELTDPEKLRRHWLIEIEEAEKWRHEWVYTAQKTLERYREQKPDQSFYSAGRKRFNIFWSNVETLKPAVYARRPKPVVERRYKDADPIARTASEVLERAVSFSIDGDEFDGVMRQCRDDYLILGRGAAWVRYVPHFEQVMPPQPEDGLSVTDDAEEHEGEANEQDSPAEELSFEEVAVDYVNWRDFLLSPARTWREVRWVSRCVQMCRDELIERFGEEIGREVTLDARATPGDHNERPEDRIIAEIVDRANVYEIWDKTTRKVRWLAKGYDAGLLDERDDWLRLKDFFPCPRPLDATLCTDSYLPIADFVFYKDQADELDDLTNRLSLLTEACQAKGVYDASQDATLGRLMEEGGDNTLIPVNNWAGMAAAGGLAKVVDFLPIDMFAKTINELTMRSEKVKAEIYEITGISDIIRGYSEADETATAQQIKGQFAALRLKDRQAEAARFARDIVALEAEIISEHFQPQTIAAMSGVQQMSPQEQQAFPLAIELLRNDAMRNFRVEVETDSTIAIDEQGDKQAATEFLTAMGTYLGNSLPVAQQAPELLDMIGQGAMFLSRRYRAGRQLEASIEAGFQALQQRAQMMAQNPQPSPEMKKANAEVEGIQARTQAEIEAMHAKTQAGLQADAAKMEGKMALEQYRMQAMPPQPQEGVVQ